MKLYDGHAPNSRRVRIFLAEKGVEIPLEPTEPGESLGSSTVPTASEPLQRCPALVLDDGTMITESIAICRYFEALRRDPPLFGRGAREIALVEMWNRRVELNLYDAATAVYGRLNPALKDVENRVPESDKARESRMLEFLASLDRELKDRLFIAGEHYSVADITGLVSVDVMKLAKLPVPVEFTNIHRWRAQIAARPSAAA